MEQISLRTQVAVLSVMTSLRERLSERERTEVGASVLAIMILVAAVAAAAAAAAAILSGKITGAANSI